MKVNTLMIKKVDMDFMCGHLVIHIEENFLMIKGKAWEL